MRLSLGGPDVCMCVCAQMTYGIVPLLEDRFTIAEVPVHSIESEAARKPLRPSAPFLTTPSKAVPAESRMRQEAPASCELLKAIWIMFVLVPGHAT